MKKIRGFAFLTVLTVIIAGVFAACGKEPDPLDGVTIASELYYQDTSLDLVHDAPYSIELNASSFETEDGVTVSIDDIRLPYINLRSDDAKKINSEIKDLYMRLATSFRAEEDGLRRFWEKADYTTSVDGDVVTVTITVTSGGTGLEETTEVITYGINVNTGESVTASIEETPES